MIEECRWCAKVQSEAANKVARYLMDRSRPVTRADADYMQAYVRLCHRIDLALRVESWRSYWIHTRLSVSVKQTLLRVKTRSSIRTMSKRYSR